MKLAADANVLLSAVIGGRAGIVLSHPEVEEVITTATVFAEVEEYSAVLGRKEARSRNADAGRGVSSGVDCGASSVCGVDGQGTQADRKTEPDDVELLALALHFEVPLWSNDRDFEGCGVEQIARRSC